MSFRIAYRVLRIVAVTSVGFLIGVAIMPMRALAPGLRLRIRNRAFRIWSRNYCRALGVRIEVRGTPPAGRFFLVSNHVSYTDIPLLATQLDGAFVAKADLRGWPVLGTVFALADTIFIDRGRKRDLLRVMRLVERSLEDGLGVVVFPEGTSSDGKDMLRFKPSLLELAARRREPVYYVTLSYHTPTDQPPANDVVCWWNGTPFAGHFFRLLKLPGFEARLHFGAEPIVDSDRKQLAGRLRAAMKKDFRPVS